MINADFWKGKNVFLTGHTGFKGGWLAFLLKSLGARVTGYSLQPPFTPNFYDLLNVKSNITDLRGDIRHLEALTTAMKQSHPDVLIHMAAQSLVLTSYANPLETYETNVMGTLNVLEAIRHTGGVKAVVIVTSDKCYDNPPTPKILKESDPMGGLDPYSSSKGCAELATAAYRHSFFPVSRYPEHRTAVASARSGNVIGGGDWSDNRLIPDLVKSFLNGQPATIRRPDSVRPWQHVLEPLSGYLILAQRLWADGPAFSEGWNFGPSEQETYPVSWVADQMVGCWGNGTRWINAQDPHAPHEAPYLILDSAKSIQRLGWKPVWSPAKAIAATVEWYKAYQRNASPQELEQLSLKQFSEYLAGQRSGAPTRA